MSPLRVPTSAQLFICVKEEAVGDLWMNLLMGDCWGKLDVLICELRAWCMFTQWASSKGVEHTWPVCVEVLKTSDGFPSYMHVCAEYRGQCFPLISFVPQVEATSLMISCAKLSTNPGQSLVKGDTFCSFSGSYFYFGVTTRIGLHVLMLKTHRFPHTVQCCSSVFLLSLKHSILAPVSLRPPSRIPSLLWLVNSHMPEPGTLNNNKAAVAKFVVCSWGVGTIQKHELPQQLIKLHKLLWDAETWWTKVSFGLMVTCIFVKYMSWLTFLLLCCFLSCHSYNVNRCQCDV